MNIGYSGVIAGILAKLLYKIKLIVDTGDVVYELFKTTGQKGFLGLLLTKIVEDSALKLSDAIIVRGSFHKTWLEEQGYKNIFHLPDGVDTSFSKPMDVQDIRERLGLSEYFIIGMMGTTNWSKKLKFCYGWELIETLKYLKNLKVKGVIIGSGTGLPKLKQRAEELGILDNVIFVGRIPYSAVPKYISFMDVCISTQTNNLVGKVRTTGKLIEYLACGKYVIATDVGDAKDILKNIGMLLPYHGVKDENYPKLLADKIKWLIQNKEELKKGKLGIKIVKEHFDYQILSDKLCHILKTVVNKKV
jgi:glycosyltransferase involved in cell wall biosynthesis